MGKGGGEDFTISVVKSAAGLPVMKQVFICHLASEQTEFLIFMISPWY